MGKKKAAPTAEDLLALAATMDATEIWKCFIKPDSVFLTLAAFLCKAIVAARNEKTKFLDPLSEGVEKDGRVTSIREHYQDAHGMRFEAIEAFAEIGETLMKGNDSVRAFVEFFDNSLRDSREKPRPRGKRDQTRDERMLKASLDGSSHPEIARAEGIEEEAARKAINRQLDWCDADRRKAQELSDWNAALAQMLSMMPTGQ